MWRDLRAQGCLENEKEAINRTETVETLGDDEERNRQKYF